MDIDKRNERQLISYLAGVIVLGWLGRLVDVLLAGRLAIAPGIALWIASPLLVSLVLRWRNRDWKDLGIKPRFKKNIRWYLFSLGVFPLVVVVVLLYGGIMHSVEILSWNITSFLQSFLLITPAVLLVSILEEFGWRGYFSPKIYKMDHHDFWDHIIIGLTWGCWYLPYLHELYPASQGHFMQFIVFFLLGSVAVSMVYGEVRLRTKSVWPAVVMHTGARLFGSALLLNGYIQILPGRTLLFSPVEGALSTIIFFSIGFVMMQRRMDRQKYFYFPAD